jgi:hypothetical protein
MTRVQYLFLFSFLCILVIAQSRTVSGFRGSTFSPEYEQGYTHWIDNWGIDRTYYGGSNGYLPNLATETLGVNKELAYSIGQRFQSEYQSETERAVAILKYVQKWTEYGYDSENVIIDGEYQEEWAWNADEMAHNFSETTGMIAVGDCEDMAFLCGTIFVGAGFDSVIVDATDHVAMLIWLPEFSNANSYWDVPNDGRDAGWIWVEATGGSNPLGWTPPDYQSGGWTAYPIGDLEFAVAPEPTESATTSIDLEVLMVIAVAVISIIGALIKARGR